MYGRQSVHLSLPYIFLLILFFSNVYHSTCVWPAALKLGCITNFDMLFLEMGIISLVDEIQFMLISSRHICIRTITTQPRFSYYGSGHSSHSTHECRDWGYVFPTQEKEHIGAFTSHLLDHVTESFRALEKTK